MSFQVCENSVEPSEPNRAFILRDGHEIGHHGYHHLLPDPGAPFIEEELERGFETLNRRVGTVSRGYRAPFGEFTEDLRTLLAARGILYTSSFRDDVRPYRHVLAEDDRAPRHAKLRRLDARALRVVLAAPDPAQGARALALAG